MITNRYGPGKGSIMLDNVNCVGNEVSIADCPHNGWLRHDCDHSKDVAVWCVINGNKCNKKFSKADRPAR